MTSPQLLPGWYPLLQSTSLRRLPVARQLAGRKILLSRLTAGRAAACDAITGETLRTAEIGGWVHVAESLPQDACAPDAQLLPGPYRTFLTEGFVKATLGDVGENILDTTHTSVVHQDYLRRPGERRAVQAAITAGDNWIRATYPPGAAPSGWGARLIGAQRYTICDTFRSPSIAEVTYTDDERPVFAARFQLAPARPGETFVAATVAVPGRGISARLKLAALRAFFIRIFAEDRAILELIAANREAHRGAPIVFAPQDLLRPGIEAILAGRAPVVASPRTALLV